MARILPMVYVLFLCFGVFVLVLGLGELDKNSSKINQQQKEIDSLNIVITKYQQELINNHK